MPPSNRLYIVQDSDTGRPVGVYDTEDAAINEGIAYDPVGPLSYLCIKLNAPSKGPKTPFVTKPPRFHTILRVDSLTTSRVESTDIPSYNVVKMMNADMGCISYCLKSGWTKNQMNFLRM